MEVKCIQDVSLSLLDSALVSKRKRAQARVFLISDEDFKSVLFLKERGQLILLKRETILVLLGKKLKVYFFLRRERERKRKRLLSNEVF